MVFTSFGHYSLVLCVNVNQHDHCVNITATWAKLWILNHLVLLASRVQIILLHMWMHVVEQRVSSCNSVRSIDHGRSIPKSFVKVIPHQ